MAASPRKFKAFSSTQSGLLLLFTLMQVIFWTLTRQIPPEMEIVPEPITYVQAQIQSLGDEQLFFRLNAFHMQNAGATFGRNIELERFNYRKLFAWFKLLDRFDDDSNMIPALASYFYSRTSNVQDLGLLVRYLQEYARFRLESKWSWQVEAVHIADHKMNDRDKALEMALPLLDLHNVPIIVRELPAFIYERRGETAKARAVIEEIQADSVLPQGELNFMNHFINSRLTQKDPQTLYFDDRPKPVSATQ